MSYKFQCQLFSATSDQPLESKIMYSSSSREYESRDAQNFDFQAAVSSTMALAIEDNFKNPMFRDGGRIEISIKKKGSWELVLTQVIEARF